MRRSQATARVVISVGFLFGLVALLVIATRATSLRPVADDYCYGAVAVGGFAESIAHWWWNWSGDVLLYALKTALVGAPLANGWTFASAIPLLMAGLFLGLAVASLLPLMPGREFRTRNLITTSVISRGALLVAAPLLWWASWYLVAVSREPNIERIAGFLTHWQDVNVGYVLAPSICLLICVMIWRLTSRGGRGVMVLSSVLVATIPLLSLTFGISLLLLLIVGLPLAFLYGRNSDSREVRIGTYLSVGLIVGTASSLLAPGTAKRVSNQGQRSMEVSSVLTEIGMGTSEVVTILGNPGLVLTFLAFVALGGISRVAGWRLDATRASKGIGVVLAVTGLLVPVTLISQLFNYPALWHWVAVLTLLQITLAASSFLLGDWIVGKLDAKAWIFSTGMTFVFLVLVLPLGALSLQAFTNAMTTRLVLWEVGPAPTVANADVSPGSGWGICWSRIEPSFDGLDRELFDGYMFDRPPTMPLPF